MAPPNEDAGTPSSKDETNSALAPSTAIRDKSDPSTSQPHQSTGSLAAPWPEDEAPSATLSPLRYKINSVRDPTKTPPTSQGRKGALYGTPKSRDKHRGRPTRQRDMDYDDIFESMKSAVTMHRESEQKFDDSMNAMKRAMRGFMEIMMKADGGLVRQGNVEEGDVEKDDVNK